jgi:TonB family protein
MCKLGRVSQASVWDEGRGVVPSARINVAAEADNLVIRITEFKTLGLLFSGRPSRATFTTAAYGKEPVVREVQIEYERGYVPPIAPQDMRKDIVTDRPPVVTPVTKMAQLKDRRKAAKIVESHYPNELKKAGVGGAVTVWVYIDTDGRVKEMLLHRTSGNELLDEAAMAALSEFEFIQARLHDEVVPVWVAFPVSFQVRR